MKKIYLIHENKDWLQPLEKVLLDKGIPFTELNEYIKNNKQDLLNKNLLFYCRVGHRSALAVQISKNYNLENSHHLIGGMKNLNLQNLKQRKILFYG